MKVLIIEDHTAVAEALRLGLSSEGMEVEIWDGEQDLAALCDRLGADVIILDLDLGEGESGIDLVPEVATEGRRVVVLTGLTDDRILAAAYEAGVDAVVDKSTPFSDLVARVTETVESPTRDPRRDAIIRRARTAAAERHDRLEPFRRLTEREQEVLALMIDGKRAAEIADATFVSMATVRSHIRSILSKLGVTSQLAAVSMAIRAEWNVRRRHPSGREKGK